MDPTGISAEASQNVLLAPTHPKYFRASSLQSAEASAYSNICHDSHRRIPLVPGYLAHLLGLNGCTQGTFIFYDLLLGESVPSWFIRFVEQGHETLGLSRLTKESHTNFQIPQ
jgi:hypothetical protein